MMVNWCTCSRGAVCPNGLDTSGWCICKEGWKIWHKNRSELETDLKIDLKFPLITNKKLLSGSRLANLISSRGAAT